MKRLAGFLGIGAIRLSRQIPDLVVTVLFPVVSVLLFSVFRFKQWIPVLLLSGGTPLVLMCGYDFGRVHETGIFRRLAVCGLSSGEIFRGIALPRMLLFLAVMPVACIAGVLTSGSGSIHGLLFALAGSSVIFAAVGLLFYRISGSALGVLSWGSVGTLLLAVPILGPSRGAPEWIPLLSPVSSVLLLADTRGIAPFVGTVAWVCAAAAAMPFLSGLAGRR